MRVVVRRILAFIERGHRAAWIALAHSHWSWPRSSDRSLIIVAHRLTIVRHCSGLLFVGSGQVVDSGTFDELLDRNAEFRRMVQMGPASLGSPDA